MPDSTVARTLNTGLRKTRVYREKAQPSRVLGMGGYSVTPLVHTVALLVIIGFRKPGFSGKKAEPRVFGGGRLLCDAFNMPLTTQ